MYIGILWNCFNILYYMSCKCILSFWINIIYSMCSWPVFRCRIFLCFTVSNSICIC